MRVKVNLDTMNKIKAFVKVAEGIRGNVCLTNDNHQFVVSGKSLMGVIYSLEWSDGTWLECDEDDAYSKFRDFMED